MPRMLPNFAQNLATDVLCLRFATAEHSLVRRQDADTHPLQHFRKLARLAIDPSARFAHAGQPLNHPFTGGAVLQVDAEGLCRLRFQDLEIPDVAFTLQNFCDSHFDLGKGNVDERALDQNRVPHPRQHVRNRVGHHSTIIPINLEKEFPSCVRLPACLFCPWNQTVQAEIPKTDSADFELLVHRPRTTAQFTAANFSAAELGSFVRFCNLCFCRHGDYRPFPSRNGIPNSFSSRRASSSVFAEVTMAMFIPWMFLTLSALISGKTTCSFSPRL